MHFSKDLVGIFKRNFDVTITYIKKSRESDKYFLKCKEFRVATSPGKSLKVLDSPGIGFSPGKLGD